MFVCIVLYRSVQRTANTKT